MMVSSRHKKFMKFVFNGKETKIAEGKKEEESKAH